MNRYEFFKSVFPNLTYDQYYGNAPYDVPTHQRENGDWAERWQCPIGNAHIYNGVVVEGMFKLGSKVSVDIWASDRLSITQFKRGSDGLGHIYEYRNASAGESPLRSLILSKCWHELPKYDALKLLDFKHPNCKVWDIFQKQAKELMD